MKSKEQLIREVLKKHPEMRNSAHAIIGEIKTLPVSIGEPKNHRRRQIPTTEQVKQIMRRIKCSQQNPAQTPNRHQKED